MLWGRIALGGFLVELVLMALTVPIFIWGTETAVLYLGVITTAAALLLYFRLVKTLGSLGVASQAYLRAGWSVLLGVVLLGEAFTAQVAIGLGAIVLAVSAINARTAR